jgi:hypothetical protein
MRADALSRILADQDRVGSARVLTVQRLAGHGHELLLARRAARST